MSEELIGEWLKAASKDLKNIGYIIEDESLTSIVAFHSQQAVEKSFKALLVYQGGRIPKIHKLQTLIDTCNIDLEMDDILIQTLDGVYIESRYPGNIGLLPEGSPKKEKAKELYEFALNIFDKVCGIVGVDKNEIE